MWGAVLVAVSTASAIGLLLWLYGGGSDARTSLDAIRTAASLGIGTGGAVALLLAARRQRAVEHDLLQKQHAHQLQERVAADNRYDALERRITELQAKAGEQLGSDKAAVRLNGLFSLERLAQDNPPHRQTIVSLICAYLRMPTAPALRGSARGLGLRPRRPHWQRSSLTPPDSGPDKADKHELLVRRTAQRILTDHLRPERDDSGTATNSKFWPDIDLDLTGATLTELDLATCEVRHATFAGSSFLGDALLGCRFNGRADFRSARFDGTCAFEYAEFGQDVVFTESRFAGTAAFSEVRFGGQATFDNAEFTGVSSFSDADFHDLAIFSDARFEADARFDGAHFRHDAVFSEARFHRAAAFGGVRFARDAVFSEAEFRGDVTFDPSSRVVLDGATAHQHDGPRSWPRDWESDGEGPFRTRG